MISTAAPGLVTPDDEFGLAQLSARDFDRLAALINGVTGIKMPRTKLSMVEGRLRRRLAATGAADFATYCARLFQQGESGPEMVHLIDAITTNKTDFFREPEHFRLLASAVLPELCRDGHSPQIWSAACSNGAEPYTLAMVISEYFAERRSASMSPPTIFATDISTQMLATARLGIYPADLIAPVPPPLRARYVLRARDKKSSLVRIAPELRAMIRFGPLNLMAEHYDMVRDLDIIFCRNVLIYFDRDTQAAVLRRLCEHLRPGGALALGHSETINGFNLPVRQIGHTMFRRT